MHSLVLEAVEPILHRSVILGKFPARFIEQVMPILLIFLKATAGVLAYTPHNEVMQQPQAGLFLNQSLSVLITISAACAASMASL